MPAPFRYKGFKETVVYRRVCDRIEPDRSTKESARVEVPIADRWSVLTTELPLAGGEAMRPGADGGFPALEALSATMPWASTLVADMEQSIRVQLALGRPWVQIDPILLVGAPGVGKSWLARRMGEALGLQTAVLEFGNTSDDRQLSGTARGWNNAQPAWPLVTIAAMRSANPLLILDELDKAGGSDSHGRPHHALLSMIEPGSSKQWQDPCLLSSCDLSAVNWIACANRVDQIPAALLSRLRIVQVMVPLPEHFDAALDSVLIELGKKWHFPPTIQVMLPARAINLLQKHFNRDRSIRSLARRSREVVGAMLMDGQIIQRH